MFSGINKIIENTISETDLDYFCVILGLSPSKGARSPTLWNKVFSAEKKKIKMLPLDVSPERLEELFFCLQEHKNCLGGAIAVPYKEVMFELLKDQLSSEIVNIGAVNCFFRKNKLLSNNFLGTNTDGEAALDPINKLLENVKGMNVALVGMGGAGKAIWAFLNEKFKTSHKLTAFNRSRMQSSGTKHRPVAVIGIREFEQSLSEFDLIINATSAGSSTDLNSTPFNLDLLNNAKPQCVIYDIIYDPLKTKLLLVSEGFGLKTINGLRMNMIQAVLAYKYTNSTDLSLEQVFQKMEDH